MRSYLASGTPVGSPCTADTKDHSPAQLHEELQCRNVHSEVSNEADSVGKSWSQFRAPMWLDLAAGTPVGSPCTSASEGQPAAQGKCVLLCGRGHSEAENEAESVGKSWSQLKAPMRQNFAAGTPVGSPCTSAS